MIDPSKAARRRELGAVGGQPDQDDMLWQLHTLGDVAWGLVQQDDMETLGKETAMRMP